MDFKELDLLSEKVAKALYMIKNLQAEKMSLTQKLEALKAENEALAKKVGEKEDKITAASKRLEGMLDSLKILDGATAATSSQADLFGAESESENEAEIENGIETEDESEEEFLSEEVVEESLEEDEQELENTQEESEYSEDFAEEEQGSEENSEEELPY